ncbi:hypothetical protein B0F90DRAFT_1386888 [Multifurca ochricompacta]|uniref:Uncharacterized protein n=1 Tax=Multifurca ochricompacta TaxID=376703 RepID=A0AAD4LXK5_9AGAM|nr:hypothetical protein B0F90DRAFT_1386888 [Multifurca ochricompacta]
MIKTQLRGKESMQRASWHPNQQRFCMHAILNAFSNSVSRFKRSFNSFVRRSTCCLMFPTLLPHSPSCLISNTIPTPHIQCLNLTQLLTYQIYQREPSTQAFYLTSTRFLSLTNICPQLIFAINILLNRHKNNQSREGLILWMDQGLFLTCTSR